jgi:ribosomal protein S20
METRIVPEAGVPFYALPAGKYNRRTLQPREAWKALRGLVSARALLRRLRPRVVLSTGGFAGFPLAFVAERAGVPVVLLEQNATLGLANRWLAPRARRIALAMDVSLPRKLSYKTLVTGMPVREERRDPRAAKRALGFDPDRPLLLVMGGSQGSLFLNRTVPRALAGVVRAHHVARVSDRRLALPNTRSAKKRLRQNEKRRLRNRWFRGRAKTFIKKTRQAIERGDAEQARYYAQLAVKALDKAAAKGILHPNNAARRKSRLLKHLRRLEAQSASGQAA